MRGLLASDARQLRTLRLGRHRVFVHGDAARRRGLGATDAKRNLLVECAKPDDFGLHLGDAFVKVVIRAFELDDVVPSCKMRVAL